MSSIEATDGGVRVRVRVQPRASSSMVSGEREGRLCIRLTAPPVEGEANQALVEFIAKRLGVPKRSVSIVSGDRSREKTVGVSGVSIQDAETKLLAGVSRSAEPS